MAAFLDNASADNRGNPERKESQRLNKGRVKKSDIYHFQGGQ